MRASLDTVPIARIITKKAVHQARSRSELVRLVADNLEPRVRAAFLRDIGLRGDLAEAQIEIGRLAQR